MATAAPRELMSVEEIGRELEKGRRFIYSQFMDFKRKDREDAIMRVFEIMLRKQIWKERPGWVTLLRYSCLETRREMLNRRHSRKRKAIVHSLHERLVDNPSACYEEVIEAPDRDPNVGIAIYDALESLEGRTRAVMLAHAKGDTAANIARAHNISESRVWQIIDAARSSLCAKFWE